MDVFLDWDDQGYQRMFEGYINLTDGETIDPNQEEYLCTGHDGDEKTLPRNRIFKMGSS